MTDSLIQVADLSKSFAGPDGRPVPVLDGISLAVDEGEFVALLGRSGSGKSTLLRCIAGLIAPTDGEVLFRGERVVSTNRETTMVFQTFALLPWLTVQENVELGLEARGVHPAERTERALRAIDLVGLDGYESAYPKELSGGMRQRVGFARALVVEPAALLMDEPFSALDVLTSENLRGELLELWEGQRFPTKTMIMVTHNIEEAVLLADRILILGTNPGRIRADMTNPLPRPRARRTPDFDALVDEIYRLMTHRDAVPPAPPTQRGPGSLSHTPLPKATVDGLSGMAEILLSRHDGAADLADLADGLGLSVDDLLPLVDALVLLDFAELHDDELELTSGGRIFAGASIQDSKEIFARASLERAPLVRIIVRALRDSIDGTLPAGFFVDILRTGMGEDEAAGQLDLAVNWGRYAELYAYDATTGQITREDSGIGASLGDLTEPAKRGALHLYLGAAPGSGKTFAMLREGRALRERGEDVVIGYVNSHGRPRTEEAIGGLEIVPGAGRMDTAAVLARHPAVALVDDYKRNADAIGSLRAAGVEVISTADVSDLERAADVVASVTGQRPAGTLKDAVLAEADDIRFVDISPEALLKRMGHGNIYPSDGAPRELAALFTPATLAGLREIGLRTVAETLTDPAPDEQRDRPNVLVAASSRAQADALVPRGVRLARPSGATCTVLVSSALASAIRSAARDAGADLIVRSGGDTAATIAQAAHEVRARHLVIAGASAGLLERWRPGVPERLAVRLPDVHLHIATHGDPGEPAAPLPERGKRGTVRVYLGYAPGSASTIAMLDEAARRRSRGSHVVVGAVGGRDLESVTALLEELELTGDGSALDTDAILLRDPEVVAVDDLAAAGPDGQTRLVAARRLADAGLNVIATVRMGSLRDGSLDEAAVLAFADEMELVDAPPSELVPREAASSPAGLGALREQAFAIVAEHADRRLATYRRADDATPVILLAVAPRPGQEPLIRRSAALAAKVAGTFAVVQTGGTAPDGYEALTAQLGGEYTVLPDASPAALTELARRRGATEILLPRDTRQLRDLIRFAGGSEIHLLPEDWS